MRTRAQLAAVYNVNTGDQVTMVTMVNNVNMVEGCEGDLVTAGRGLQLGHSEHCEHIVKDWSLMLESGF